jgi:hypothetical protein
MLSGDSEVFVIKTSDREAGVKSASTIRRTPLNEESDEIAEKIKRVLEAEG